MQHKIVIAGHAAEQFDLRIHTIQEIAGFSIYK